MADKVGNMPKELWDSLMTLKETIEKNETEEQVSFMETHSLEVKENEDGQTQFVHVPI